MTSDDGLQLLILCATPHSKSTRALVPAGRQIDPLNRIGASDGASVSCMSPKMIQG
jgi:hypothetical protein